MLNRRGFLKGIGAAAVGTVVGSQVAPQESMPVVHAAETGSVIDLKALSEGWVSKRTFMGQIDAPLGSRYVQLGEGGVVKQYIYVAPGQWEELYGV